MNTSETMGRRAGLSTGSSGDIRRGTIRGAMTRQGSLWRTATRGGWGEIGREKDGTVEENGVEARASGVVV